MKIHTFLARRGRASLNTDIIFLLPIMWSELCDRYLVVVYQFHTGLMKNFWYRPLADWFKRNDADNLFSGIKNQNKSLSIKIIIFYSGECNLGIIFYGFINPIQVVDNLGIKGWMVFLCAGVSPTHNTKKCPSTVYQLHQRTSRVSLMSIQE